MSMYLYQRRSQGRARKHVCVAAFAAAGLAASLSVTVAPSAYAAAAQPAAGTSSAAPAATGSQIVNAVPIANLPLYQAVAPGEEVDHYSQGPGGSTILVRTFSGSAAAQIAATQYQTFSYTYDFDSNLRGRTMQTTDGTFCNVVDTINPPGQPYSNFDIQLVRDSSGATVYPEVHISQPGTGWCWHGNATYTNYHYNYVHGVGYYGFYINGTGHSYG